MSNKTKISSSVHLLVLSHRAHLVCFALTSSRCIEAAAAEQPVYHNIKLMTHNLCGFKNPSLHLA